MVRYEERDICMSRENQRELIERLGVSEVDVPQVFADGQHIGVSETVRLLLFFPCPLDVASSLFHVSS